MSRTAVEFQAQAATRGIDYWPQRRCSICGYELAYVFCGSHVGFDSGCGCGPTRSRIQPRDWDSVAEQYNRQTNPNVIAEYDRFWGFNEVK